MEELVISGLVPYYIPTYKVVLKDGSRILLVIPSCDLISEFGSPLPTILGYSEL